MGGVLAAKGMPSAYALFWIIVAATGARNFAMSLNRFADRHFDPENPRTRDRAEFQALLGSSKIWVLMIVFAGIFILS